MNYRKWPVQSVLRLILSALTFVNSAAWDVYFHVAHGRHFGIDTLLLDLAFAGIIGWWILLPGTAKWVGTLIWFAGSLVIFAGYYAVEKTIHLSRLTDTLCTEASEVLYLFVAMGAVLMWQRRKRMKEIRTMP